MANTNIINAVFGSGICAVTTSAFRANYGMVLRFSGIDLPTAFECDFSNYDVMGRDSITMIGQNNEVQIPDDLWDSGLNIYAYVYLHPTDDSGVTVYTVTIPVLGRPNRTEEEPTPHEQTLIEQAISALNDAVEATAADVETTTANAQAAAQSEANAATSERSAAASASAALASQNAAHASETASAQSAQSASGSADQASQSAQASAESADTAQGAAASAERSEQNASASAASAQSKANEAASSAATASGKATESAQSASSAASAAQNAASAATAAESSATDAEQAKTDAQDAKDAAEQAAESVSGLSAQIAQNTADIAELVQSKAGVLVDTVSGSIASFVPDATVPTVKGLTVDIEPQQDLHGYDNPWPAGGGKNLLSYTEKDTDSANGVTWTRNEDGSISFSGTCSAAKSMTFVEFKLPAGDYLFSNVGSTFAYTGGNRPIAYVRDLDNSLSLANIGFGQSASGVAFSLSATTNLRFYVVFQTGNVVSGVLYPMIRLETESDATYAPYSNICPISGWSSVELDANGVNLFGGEVNQIAFGNFIDGAKIISGASYRSIFARVKSGKTYTVSRKIIEGNRYRVVATTDYPASGVPCRILANDAQQDNALTVTATIPDGYNYIFVYLSNQSDPCTAGNYQVELGSTATAYKPYQGEPITIPLGQTVYGGTLDVTNGVLTVDRAMVTFDGSSDEHWALQSVNSYGIANFYTDVDHYPATNYRTACNMLSPQTSFIAITETEGYYVHQNGSTVYIRILSSRASTVNEFKTWLSQNNIQLVYTLATPIVIDLDPVTIATIANQINNVLADSGDVAVEYAADLKTYIDQKIAAAVAALS